MNKTNDKNIHDINSALSSLLNALEIVKDQWRDNQQLVERIVPLSVDKLEELKNSLDQYYNNH